MRAGHFSPLWMYLCLLQLCSCHLQLLPSDCSTWMLLCSMNHSRNTRYSCSPFSCYLTPTLWMGFDCHISLISTGETFLLLVKHPEILRKRAVYNLELKEACKYQGWSKDELQEECDTKSQENVMWTCSFPCATWKCSGANFISSTPARIGDAAEVQLHYWCYIALSQVFWSNRKIEEHYERWDRM